MPGKPWRMAGLTCSWGSSGSAKNGVEPTHHDGSHSSTVTGRRAVKRGIGRSPAKLTGDPRENWMCAQRSPKRVRNCPAFKSFCRQTKPLQARACTGVWDQCGHRTSQAPSIALLRCFRLLCLEAALKRWPVGEHTPTRPSASLRRRAVQCPTRARAISPLGPTTLTAQHTMTVLGRYCQEVSTCR